MKDLVSDIAIIGGGVAGMSAGIAAARCGAKTVLLEKCVSLGGVLWAGVDFPVCGLFDSGGDLLNGGLSQELFEVVGVRPELVGKVYIWPCGAKKLLRIFAEKLSDEKNLSIMMESEVCGVEIRSGVIEGVRVGGELLQTKFVVDCSGDGVVAEHSSAEVIAPDKDVLAGYAVRMGGLVSDPMLPLKVAYVLRMSALCEYLQFSVWMPPDCLKLAVPSNIDDDVLCSNIEQVMNCLKVGLPAFRNAFVMETSPYVMRREGKRIRGKYVLSAEDVRGCVRFDDVVARCAWPMETWALKRGQQLEYLPNQGVYEIPLRCLQSVNVNNLLAAGRSISATSKALASVRVMGTCIATGEAAGRTAANLL